MKRVVALSFIALLLAVSGYFLISDDSEENNQRARAIVISAISHIEDFYERNGVYPSALSEIPEYDTLGVDGSGLFFRPQIHYSSPRRRNL